jgi:hypothetical protein
LFTLIQSSKPNEDWCLWTRSDRNLHSVAGVRAVTPHHLLIVKAVISKRKLWDTWPWAFSHCWGV